MAMALLRVMMVLAAPSAAAAGIMSWGPSCAANASAGPEGYDVEVVVGGLPSGARMHFWAARASETVYDPLSDTADASYWGSLHAAYPDLGDEDYNGGLATADRSGRATIRIRAPGRHPIFLAWGPFVFCWPRLPHVHFNVCQSGVSQRTHTILFKPGVGLGAVIEGGCHGQQSYTVESAAYHQTEESTTTTTKFSTTTTATATATMTATVTATTTTTVAATTTTAAALALPTAQEESAANFQSEETTTDAAPTTTAAAPAFPMAQEEEAWDAIEFSPVYKCLDKEQLYDHFAEQCVDRCGPDAEMKHGQCVRPAAFDDAVLSAAWRLRIDCNEECWTSAFRVTLHAVRLEVAGHLDVPWQEVQRLLWRKDDREPDTHAVLKVTVLTRRHDESEGLRQLLALWNHTDASDVFGLDVQAAEAWDPAGFGGLEMSPLPGEQADVFAGNYAPLEKKAEGRAGGARLAGVDLPFWAIAAIAAVVVLLLGGALGVRAYRRRAARAGRARLPEKGEQLEKWQQPEDFEKGQHEDFGKDFEKAPQPAEATKGASSEAPAAHGLEAASPAADEVADQRYLTSV